MEQRLIEIVLPEGKGDDIKELLHGQHLMGYWRDGLAENKARVRILLKAVYVEPVLDILEPYLEQIPGSSALLLIVEASIPRALPAEISSDDQEEPPKNNNAHRISRQELYLDVAANVGISSTYLIMVVLSAIIASIGLIRNDMAIIIGAMVLAPLLMPQVGLALASTLGDKELAAKALRAGSAGFAMALAIGWIIGMIYGVDPEISAIQARVGLSWSDLVLAFSAGVAGVLAFTSGGQLSLIGVMVAVALMPPLVTAGLLFGSSHFAEGINAFELACANVICINLAGIVTFTLQGIRPATWWEKSKAHRAKRRAAMIWVGLLVFLFVLML